MKNIIFIIFLIVAMKVNANEFLVEDIDGNPYSIGSIATADEICQILGHENFNYYDKDMMYPSEYFTFPGEISTKMFQNLPPDINQFIISSGTISEIKNNVSRCIGTLVSENKKGADYMSYFIQNGLIKNNLIRKGYLDGDNSISNNFDYLPIMISYKDGHEFLINELNSTLVIRKSAHQAKENARISSEQEQQKIVNEKKAQELMAERLEQERIIQEEYDLKMSKKLNIILNLAFAAASIVIFFIANPFIRKWVKRNKDGRIGRYENQEITNYSDD